MQGRGLQLSLSSLLALVACVGLNVWLFRLGVLWGILGLNVTKHVLIAALCRGLGIDEAGDTPGKGRAAYGEGIGVGATGPRG